MRLLLNTNVLSKVILFCTRYVEVYDGDSIHATLDRRRKGGTFTSHLISSIITHTHTHTNARKAFTTDFPFHNYLARLQFDLI